MRRPAYALLLIIVICLFGDLAMAGPRFVWGSFKLMGEIGGQDVLFEVKCINSTESQIAIYDVEIVVGAAPPFFFAADYKHRQTVTPVKKLTPDNLAQALTDAAFDRVIVYPPGTGAPLRGSSGSRQQELRANRIYVSSKTFPTSITAYDVESNQVVGSIEVEPRLPGGVAASPDGKFVYATLWRSDRVSPPLPAQVLIIDQDVKQVLHTINLRTDMQPAPPVVSPDGKWLYVADATAGIVFIDLERRAVEHTLPPPVVMGQSGPVTIPFRTPAISPDGSLLYVSHSSGTGIVDVRSRSYVGRVGVTAANAELPPVFNLTGNRAYVIERRTAVENNQLFTRVWLVETDTAMAAEVNRIPLPDNFDPDDIRLSRDGLLLTAYGFVRPVQGQAKVILILIDVTAQRVASITDVEVSDRVGKIGAYAVR